MVRTILPISALPWLGQGDRWALGFHWLWHVLVATHTFPLLELWCPWAKGAHDALHDAMLAGLFRGPIWGTWRFLSASRHLHIFHVSLSFFLLEGWIKRNDQNFR